MVHGSRIFFAAAIAGTLLCAVCRPRKERLGSVTHPVPLLGMSALSLVAYIGITEGWAALIGAACGMVFGAFASYLIFGVAARVLICRWASILWCLGKGIKQLPQNWWNNQLVIDSTTSPEMLPGIGQEASRFTFSGSMKVIRRSEYAKDTEGFFIMAGTVVVWFLPVVLYRINIKATGWFYWPLVYLLAPEAEAIPHGQRKEFLLRAWGNPAWRMFLLVSIVLVAVSQLFAWLPAQHRPFVDEIEALPLPLQILLCVGGSGAPWRWAWWVIAGTAVGLLIISGQAVSAHAADEWAHYVRRKRWHSRAMIWLRRIHVLGVVGLLVMAFGALLLHEQHILEWLGLPARQRAALEQFYQVRR